MQKIVFVKNGDVTYVNQLLEEGYIVKDIKTINNNVALSCGNKYLTYEKEKGDVYAYIVLEKLSKGKNILNE